MDIQLKELTYYHSQMEKNLLENISFLIPGGNFACLVGASGAGKSTLLQCIAGLERITSGECSFDQEVGIVFQYPEQQIFAATVAEEIGYALKNKGMDPEDIASLVHQTMDWVGLPQSILADSPRQLSGGQMRRVALASVLVMQPSLLLLDEPTAGLDAQGTQETMGFLRRLQREQNMTVIMATHEMNIVAEYADMVVVLEKGRCVFQGTPLELFSDLERLHDWALELPGILQWVHKFNRHGERKLSGIPLTMDELIWALEEWRSR